jgi:hypothetical protein
MNLGRALRRWSLAAAALLALVLPQTASADVDLTGTWKANYHCTSGWCAGQDFPDTYTLTQTGSAVTGTGGGSEIVQGTVSGSTYTFTSIIGSYRAFFTLTVSADGSSWSGPGTDTNGTAGTETATRQGFSIAGTVTEHQCTDTSCTDHPIQGITVNATGDAARSAVTDANGTYKLNGLPAGHYTVKPAFTDGRKPDPEDRSYDLTGNVDGADFSVCPVDGATGTVEVSPGIRLRSTSSASEPCKRTYTLVVKAWIPQDSVVDQSLVGANTPGGNDFPTSSLAHTFFTTDAFPPCLKPDVLKGFVKDRKEVYWRSRWLGDGHAGYQGGGWGTVTIPIVYDGGRERFDVRNASVVPGTMRRAYDWSFHEKGGTVKTCVVKREITPLVGVYDAGDNRFEIDISWPIPFKPLEDLGDVQDYAALTVDKVTKPIKDEMEKYLEKLPGYKELPEPQKAKVRSWSIWLIKTVGFNKAKGIIDAAWKKAHDYLTDKTPPPVKVGKKAFEILQKLAYGSGDVKIVGHFDKTRFGVGLTLTVDADAWPSFGLQVQRTATETNPLRWRGDTDSLKVVNPFSGPDYVINDATTTMGHNFQGGPGAKALLVSNLSILLNKTPGLLAPFFPPHLTGGSQTKTMSWSFISAKS